MENMKYAALTAQDPAQVSMADLFRRRMNFLPGK